MVKEFVTYEIALKLKELGFNKPCLGFLALTDKKANLIFHLSKRPQYDTTDDGVLSTPLWQQVIDWFRERYRLDIVIKFPEAKDGKKHEGINSSYYDIEIRSLFQGDVWNRYKFCQYSDDYYEARKKAIECAIEEINLIK